MNDRISKSGIHRVLLTAAAILAAAVMALSVPVSAREVSDPTGVTDILTSETEKEKLREALIELERRGLTPRTCWEKILRLTDGKDLPDAQEFLQDAQDGAAELMEDASSQFSEDVEKEIKESFFEWLLRKVGEKKEALFGG